MSTLERATTEQSGLSDAMPQTECPPGKESTEAPTSNPHGTWPRCLSATRPAEVVRRLLVNPTCYHKTAHRLPCSVLFAHPDCRFRHCVNGPPFCDDKTSGGGVETERRAEMTIMLVSAGWGSRRGGVCENPSHPWQAGRGGQRGLTRRKDAQKRWRDRREGSQSKTRPGSEWQGTGRCDGSGLSAKRREKQRSVGRCRSGRREAGSEPGCGAGALVGSVGASRAGCCGHELSRKGARGGFGAKVEASPSTRGVGRDIGPLARSPAGHV